MAASTALQVLVSPFLGTVFENLGSLIQKEIGLVLGVEKELVKLSDTLSTIRDVIDDAEAKQIDDKPIYNWLRRLKDLAYEADDILDECATEWILEILKLCRMDSLKCVGDEFYGDHHPQSSLFFPKLKELEIRKMPNLEEWYASSSQGELPVFPSLEDLRLEGCPKLRTLPTTLSFSLKNLELRYCNEMLNLESLPPNSSSCLNSLVNVMGGLQRLDIIYCDKIESLPLYLSSTLTELHIQKCEELVCLPEEMQNLTSLKTFKIGDCSSLKYLPELGSRNNTALTRLDIQNCKGLTSVSDCLRHLTALEDLFINGTSPELEFLQNDFQDLTSLRYLGIWCLPQMTCLPEGLQQVAGTLESLAIRGCSGLTSLPEWMYKFTSLRRLIIESCENLKVLPEEVLHLTTLKTVRIEDCHPYLHKRYAKETGEDWHKIAHIPDLDIMVSSMHGGGKRRMKCRNIISCFSSLSSDTNFS